MLSYILNYIVFDNPYEYISCNNQTTICLVNMIFNTSCCRCSCYSDTEWMFLIVPITKKLRLRKSSLKCWINLSVVMGRRQCLLSINNDEDRLIENDFCDSKYNWIIFIIMGSRHINNKTFFFGYSNRVYSIIFLEECL